MKYEKMRIIKEVVRVNLSDPDRLRETDRIIIRTRTYACTMGYFKHLVKIARNNFPHLTDADEDEMEVMVYGGERYARTRGIEFSIPRGTGVPNNYRTINQVEVTLA